MTDDDITHWIDVLSRLAFIPADTVGSLNTMSETRTPRPDQPLPHPDHQPDADPQRQSDQPQPDQPQPDQPDQDEQDEREQ